MLALLIPDVLVLKIHLSDSLADWGLLGHQLMEFFGSIPGVASPAKTHDA